MKHIFKLLFIIVMFASCGEGGSGQMEEELVQVRIIDLLTEERLDNSTISVELRLSMASSVEVSVEYAAISKTATEDKDFTPGSGTIVFEPGTTKKTIDLTILDDEFKEMEEYFVIQLSNPTNANFEKASAIIKIKDNDVADYTLEDGYSTNSTIDGYTMAWSDEFDDNSLNAENWSYELGDGCDIGLCGWGNNELQEYTEDAQNVAVGDGKLTITARRNGSSYSSGRIISKGKQEYQFGRIDIRAKLPKGQGLWPAIWMLGANIDNVGWPVCGEIDIMELIGSKPEESSAAAHWGNSGEGSTFQYRSYKIDDEFAEHFHVFSILWKQNEIQYYVDETKFFEISLSSTTGFAYPFNASFFFIMNVAVGGNLPGAPDMTTPFPQSMVVDYIRVFQEK